MTWQNHLKIAKYCLSCKFSVWKKNKHSHFYHNLGCNMNETSYLEQTRLYWLHFFQKKVKDFCMWNLMSILQRFQRYFTCFSYLCSYLLDQTGCSGQQIIVCTTRDIHIECSKQFKWNLYFYVSGQSWPIWSALKLL